MIRPVGVEHADLSHGRIAHLLPGEVFPDEPEVAVCHGQRQGVIQSEKRIVIHRSEVFKYPYAFRLIKMLDKCLRLLIRRDSRVNRVAAVLLDQRELLVTYNAAQDIYCCGADQRLNGLIQQLYTLNRGIGSLVELSGEVLNREDPVSDLGRKCLFIQVIDGRLREHCIPGLLIYLIWKVLDIIPDENAQALKAFKSQVAAKLVRQVMRLSREGFLLLCKYTTDVIHPISFLSEAKSFPAKTSTMLFPFLTYAAFPYVSSAKASA